MTMLSVSSRRADAGGGRSRRHPKGLGRYGGNLGVGIRRRWTSHRHPHRALSLPPSRPSNMQRISDSGH